ncbi:MAG TPA: zf-HC2 domain-containing protein [Chthonomonadaceae bacterium]|nr:zf-HC2 domain-containing protein [Chthonomonadaceae bacterium]
MFRDEECNRITRLLWDHAGGQLTDGERDALNGHLTRCARCRQEAARIGRTSEMVALYARVTDQAIRPDWADIADRLAQRRVRREPVHRLQSLAWAVGAVSLLFLFILYLHNIGHDTLPAGKPSGLGQTTSPGASDLNRQASKSVEGSAQSVPAAAENPPSPAIVRDHHKPVPAHAGLSAPPSPSDPDYLDGRDASLTRFWAGGRSPENAASLPDDTIAGLRDDFIRVPFPKLAGTSAKALADARQDQQKEAAILDTRLFRKVTLQFKGASLEEVCAALARSTGVIVRVSRGLRDEKATIFVKELPARDVMRALARLFGYYWLRTGEENAYKYDLSQDIRSRLMEEELRSRDLNEALLALDEAMRKHLETERGKGKIRGQEELYSRLSPTDRAALRNGERLAFRSDSPDPNRQIPEELRHDIIQEIGGSFKVTTDGRFVQPEDPEGTFPADLPGSKALVSFQLGQTELGKITLQEATGFRYPLPSGVESGVGSENGWGFARASASSPSVEKPNNASANKALQGERLFKQEVTLAPVSSCPVLKREGLPPDKQGQFDTEDELLESYFAPPMPHLTSAEVWEEVHHRTGLPIVADYYTQLYPADPFHIEQKTLFEALCRTGDALGVRWRKDGDFLLARSTGFFWARLKEIPNRLLARWREDNRRPGGLPFDDLLEMAALSDAQLDSLIVAQGIKHCLEIDAWGLVSTPESGMRSISVGRRDLLRCLASLPETVRNQALTQEGLRVQALPPDMQQAMVNAMMHWAGSPELWLSTRVRVQYVPSGLYVWHPRPGLITSGDKMLELPLIACKTREEALAMARKSDPEATDQQIQRTRGVLAITMIDPTGKVCAAYGTPGQSFR